MPCRLTDAWKRELGDDAKDQHGRWRDRLANLTLCGDTINTAIGAGTFAAKRVVYAESTIGMTRRVAEESEWNKEALHRRVLALTDRALKRWLWEDQPPNGTCVAPLKWRIGDGQWRGETVASLNVAGALLSLDSGNAARLSGDYNQTCRSPLTGSLTVPFRFTVNLGMNTAYYSV